MSNVNSSKSLDLPDNIPIDQSVHLSKITSPNAFNEWLNDVVFVSSGRRDLLEPETVQKGYQRFLELKKDEILIYSTVVSSRMLGSLAIRPYFISGNRFIYENTEFYRLVPPKKMVIEVSDVMLPKVPENLRPQFLAKVLQGIQENALLNKFVRKDFRVSGLPNEFLAVSSKLGYKEVANKSATKSLLATMNL